MNPYPPPGGQPPQQNQQYYQPPAGGNPPPPQMYGAPPGQTSGQPGYNYAPPQNQPQMAAPQSAPPVQMFNPGAASSAPPQTNQPGGAYGGYAPPPSQPAPSPYGAPPSTGPPPGQQQQPPQAQIQSNVPAPPAANVQFFNPTGNVGVAPSYPPPGGQVGGAAPPSGPPPSQPPPMAPPGQNQGGVSSLTQQISSMSVGPPPSGQQGFPPPAAPPSGPPPAVYMEGGGQPAQQQYYPHQHQPAGSMGGMGPPGGGMPGQMPGQPQGMAMGGPMPAQQQQQQQQLPPLPQLEELDLNIQCSQTVMRSSLKCVPHTQAQGTKLPIGVVVQPMAGEGSGSGNGDGVGGGSASGSGSGSSSGSLPVPAQIPLVNFGTTGIVRCKRCRTYINPYVSWLDNGRKWRCNMCGFVNDVPSTYFCHLDQNGRRKDRDERPELSLGSVEFVAPGEYMVRAPQPPVYLFLVDVSPTAIKSGLLFTLGRCLKGLIDDICRDERTLVGVVTFDTGVHYHALASNLSTPQMHVNTDLNDVFIPTLVDDLLVNASDSKELLSTFFDNLATMFGQPSSSTDGVEDGGGDMNTADPVPPSSEAALGAALHGVGRIMGSVGGKCCLFLSSLPSIGPGALRHREAPQLLGTDQEHTLLLESDQFYRNKASEFTRMQISVDMFVCPPPAAPHQQSQTHTSCRPHPAFVDLANVSVLAKVTAGGIYFYPAFDVSTGYQKLYNELSRVVQSPVALESVMRVRVTRGLKIASFHGNHQLRSNDLLALPNCSPQSVFALGFAYDEPVLNAAVVCVQAALLYTTSSGERRIRVHNLALPVTTKMEEAVAGVDVDTASNLLAKQAVMVAQRQGLEIARRRIHEACLEILRGAQPRAMAQASAMPMQHQPYGIAPPPGGVAAGAGAGPGSTGQPLVLPESLQLLPLYCMSLQKSLAFRGGNEVGIDERVVCLNYVSNMSPLHTKRFAYPRLFSIHDMSPQAGTSASSSSSDGRTPPPSGDGSRGLGGGRSVRRAGRGRGVILPAAVNLSRDSLDSGGIYLLDNSLEAYLWVGASVSPVLLQSLFGIPPTTTIQSVDRSKLKLIRSGNDMANRLNAIIDALRDESFRYLQVYIVCEGDQFATNRMQWFLVEDRASFPQGALTYREYMEIITRG